MENNPVNRSSDEESVISGHSDTEAENTFSVYSELPDSSVVFTQSEIEDYIILNLPPIEISMGDLSTQVSTNAAPSVEENNKEEEDKEPVQMPPPAPRVNREQEQRQNENPQRRRRRVRLSKKRKNKERSRLYHEKNDNKRQRNQE